MRESKENVHDTHSIDENPIPLPPRDRNKPKPTSKARHTRKHPLIIPASSIQRTLDKINVITPDEIKPNPLEHHFTNNNLKVFSDGKTEPFYVNQRIVDSDTSIETPERDFDTESLHFEAQIESALAALDEIPIDDLDTQITLPSNIRNSVIEGTVGSKTARRVSGPVNVRLRSNEVDKEGADTVDGVLHHNVDHVSCEDLLEFADTKPSSRERGNESDEVRIMSKVLGSEVGLGFKMLCFGVNNN